MEFKFFSKNGEVLPLAEAMVPLSNIEYQYGFGVYETIRAVGGTPRFFADHMERLFNSARIIGLEHSFDQSFISRSVQELIAKNKVNAANIKILLIGGKAATDASLYILCLNPLFPDKKLYEEGANFVTFEYERPFPGAKTLNMLQSYLAYRRAKSAGCYDTLLLDKSKNVLEGTRTNFLAIRGEELVSPQEEKILPGVMRKHVIEAALRIGFDFKTEDIPLSLVPSFDAAFVTSTSSKIIPIRSIDSIAMKPIPESLRKLMAALEEVLSA